MNAALADIFTKLIGSFVGDQTPQKNPNYGQMPGDVDPSFKGDPSELVQQPFVTPNFATRFFHKDVADAENAGNLQEYNAILANSVKNKVGATNASLVAPELGKPFGEITKTNPTAASLIAGNDFSANNLLNTDTSSSALGKGLAPLTADTMLGHAKEAIRESGAALATDRPELKVAAENAGNVYSGLRSNLSSSLIPYQKRFELANILQGTQEARRGVINSPLLDRLFKQGAETRLSEGTVKGALAKEQASPDSLDALISTQGAERKGRLWQAMNPDAPVNPFSLNLATGKSELRPAYVNMMRMMRAKLADNSAASAEAIPVGGGLHIVDDNSIAPAKASESMSSFPSRSALFNKNTTTPISSPKGQSSQSVAKMPSGMTYDEQVEWMKKHPKESASQPIDQILDSIGKWFMSTPLMNKENWKGNIIPAK